MKVWVLINKCDQCPEMADVAVLDLTPEEITVLERVAEVFNNNREQIAPVMEIERRNENE